MKGHTETWRVSHASKKNVLPLVPRCGLDIPAMCECHTSPEMNTVPRLDSISSSSQVPGCAALPNSIYHLWQMPAVVKVTLLVGLDLSLHLLAATQSKLYTASLDSPTSFVTTLGKMHSSVIPLLCCFHFSSFTWNTCSSRWSDMQECQTQIHSRAKFSTVLGSSLVNIV